MPIDRKLELMRDRAVRALGNHRVEQAVAKIRAIVGPENIPQSEPLAQSALDKLRNGEVPNPDELAALEIVVRLLRPVRWRVSNPPSAGSCCQPSPWRACGPGRDARTRPEKGCVTAISGLPKDLRPRI
jgi:hypothetical protein